MSVTGLISSKVIESIIEKIGIDRLMSEMISTLEEGLKNYDVQKTHIKKRDGFVYQKPSPGVCEWMPAMAHNNKVAVKIVSYSPENPQKRQMPTIMSHVSYIDTTCGHLLALVDGNFLTALRTGAMSAVASKYLAYPSTSTLGVVGCGAQAVTQVHALCLTFPIEKILIYDVDDAVMRSFSDRIGFLNVPVHAKGLSTLEKESDIICTATSVPVDKGPVVSCEHVKPWLHINSIGADLPGKYEIPMTFLSQALVCPDFLAQAVAEGECQRLECNQIGPEISSIIKNSVQHGDYKHQFTVFDSTGFAFQDLLACELLYNYAVELGVMKEVMLAPLTTDPLNPYDLGSNGDVLAVTNVGLENTQVDCVA